VGLADVTSGYRHSEYRSSRGRGSRDTSSLETTRLDQGRPSVGDTWRRSRLSGEVPIEGQIGASEFGVSQVLRTRLPEHSKSRNSERRSGPSILRGRVAVIGASRKSPERRIVNREIASRDIGNPVDKKSLQLGIAKSETPTRGRKLRCCGA
jgi:hypothetical protein